METGTLILKSLFVKNFFSIFAFYK
jgi:hypothetical protein